MNHRDICIKIILVHIFMVVIVKSCFQNDEQFQKWFDEPCGGGNETDILKHALLQMRIFKNILKDNLESINVSPDIDYYNTCPNITRLVDRVEQEKKVRVFYNMLLKLAIFIHKVTNTIDDDIYSQKLRKEMYSDILCHMKPVVCQFKIIQTRTWKKIKRKQYKVCTPEKWDYSNSNLFDKQFLQNFDRFFDKCYLLFKYIKRSDSTIRL